jgi:hypothetical protein
MPKSTEQDAPLTVSVDRADPDFIFRYFFGGRPRPRWYVRIRHGHRILREHRCRSQIQTFKLLLRIYQDWGEALMAGRPAIST